MSGRHQRRKGLGGKRGRETKIFQPWGWGMVRTLVDVSPATFVQIMSQACSQVFLSCSPMLPTLFHLLGTEPSSLPSPGLAG